MSSRLVKWNTGRSIQTWLDDLIFFENYELINKDLFDIYVHVKKYCRSNYCKNDIKYDRELYDNLITHLDNMVDFQNLVDNQDPSVSLAKEAKLRFDSEHVRSTEALDRLEIKRLELLLEYSSSIRNLFNDLVSLTSSSHTLKPSYINEIEEVLLNKGLDNFDIPNELIINNLPLN